MQYTYSTNPKVKEAASKITNKLGLPISKAIDLYLHAIINENGIPFKLQLNKPKFDSHRVIQNRIKRVENGEIGKKHHLRNV